MKFIKLTSILLSVFLAGCGGGGGDTRQISEDGSTLLRSDIRDTNLLYPYNPNSPYAEVLKDCATVDKKEDACTLQQLPFIGQNGNPVSTENIMDRLLVTHDWMGQRFAEVLNSAPRDMIDLFASVATISIGSTVRPSYYWNVTGSISLDPAYLWLSLDEKANISIDEDYRAGFGDELNYWIRQTRLVPGQPWYRFPRLDSTEIRSRTDMTLPLHSLLFHELGHAVDFVPTEVLHLVNDSMTPFTAVESLEPYRASDQLIGVSPLLSEELFSLAKVRYWRDVEATEEQKRYTPSEVGSFMSSDGAMSSYSYSTRREDFANLLEYAMMKKHHNADFVAAYVSKPANPDVYGCDELVVGWGQYNRLTDPLVWSRAKWVVERVFGITPATTTFFDELFGQIRELTPNLSWCENIQRVLPVDEEARQTGVVSDKSGFSIIEDMEREQRRRSH